MEPKGRKRGDVIEVGPLAIFALMERMEKENPEIVEAWLGNEKPFDGVSGGLGAVESGREEVGGGEDF